MPLPDFTIANPTPQETQVAAIGAADYPIQKQQIQNQAGEKLGFMANAYRGPGGSLSQLQSGLNSSGQFYGGAGNNSQFQAENNYNQSKYDVTSAMNRQLNELDRQRAYTSIGLVI